VSYSSGGGHQVHCIPSSALGISARFPHRGWALIPQDEILWDQSKGPVKAKYWNVRAHVGNR
jgi:hypothetical protein